MLYFALKSRHLGDEALAPIIGFLIEKGAHTHRTTFPSPVMIISIRGLSSAKLTLLSMMHGIWHN
jgi:hypothetical protein